jgi:hypothetical protein
MAENNSWKRDAEGSFIEMDANERKDYSIDWTDFLGVDTVATVVWVVTAPVVKLSQSETTKVGQVRLHANGAAGVYACSATMTSAGGLVDVQRFRVVIA